MGRLVIRLKAIKYKEDSFCYLSFKAVHQVVPSDLMLLGCTLFTIKSHHQAVCHQVVPSNARFYFAPNFYPNIALLLYHQKTQILNLSKKPNKASSSTSFFLVIPNSEYLKAILMLPILLIKESNRHQRVWHYCIQRVVQLGLIMEILRPQCLCPTQSNVLSWFYFISFLQFTRQ